MFSLFFFLLSTYCINIPCGFGTIDLSHLSSNTDYITIDTVDNDFYMNICSPVNNPICRSDFPLSTICQVKKGSQECNGSTCSNLASWDPINPPTWAYINSSDPNQGVSATYTNGGLCSSSGHPYIVNVRYMCYGETLPTFVIVEQSLCNLLATIFVNCNPPPVKSPSHINAALIIFIVALSMYGMFLFIGMAINRIFLKMGFPEACPHYNFWKTCCEKTVIRPGKQIAESCKPKTVDYEEI
jgi:hypothetical protein